MPSGVVSWLVTRYEDVRTALADPRLHKDYRELLNLNPNADLPPTGRVRALEANMLTRDPPDHTRLRRLVSKAFTPRRIEALRPRIKQITAGLLDAVEPGATTDLLEALAFPLPVTVICEMLTHPAELTRLRANPSLIPHAVEELLRYASPVNHATYRFAAQDVEIDGTIIPRGDLVLVAVSSANRDPERFPFPDAMDLGRDPAGHVAFGHGIHYCLGAPLARMEGEIAFGTLLERFSDITLAVPPESLRFRPGTLIRGLESLPVRLTR